MVRVRVTVRFRARFQDHHCQWRNVSAAFCCSAKVSMH